MMKKLILIILSFVFLLAGIASAQDTDIDPLYQDLINELTGILKGQDSGKLTVEKDYSVVISWLTGQPASVKIGYVLKDVDGKLLILRANGARVVLNCDYVVMACIIERF